VALEDIKALELLEAFPEAGIVMTPDGTLVFANAAAVRLFEFGGDPAGRNLTELLPERERSRLNPLSWMARWADQPDAPELAHVHLNCVTASGREVPVRVRVARVRDGAAAYYVVTLQDVSEQLERQHAERQGHRMAARVLAISADAIVNADESLHITYANPSAERLFGYASGELLGRPLNDLLPPDYRGAHEAHIREFAGESSPARLMGERSEVQGLTRSGDVVPLEASITKVTIDQRTVFSAHLRDLRLRKSQEQALARSLASFETVFEHALQAMALIGTDGRVQQINRAARRLLPANVEAVGAPFAELPFWSDDPAATAGTLREAIEACRRGEIYRVPARVRLPDGEELQLDFSLSPVIQNGATFALIAEARTLLDQEATTGA
jgi:PAS domain S-box-containing protein